MKTDSLRVVFIGSAMDVVFAFDVCILPCKKNAFKQLHYFFIGVDDGEKKNGIILDFCPILRKHLYLCFRIAKNQ